MQPRHRPGRLDPGGGLGAVRWSTDEDEPSAAVAIGAEDLDGDTLSFDLKDGAGPEKGAVTLGANGTFAYVPNANATGTDTFTIVVSNGQSEFEQVVTATIAPVNDAPNGALTNVVATAEDTASGPVLIGAGDLDGHALTYSVQSGAEPEKGTVAFDRDAAPSPTPRTRTPRARTRSPSWCPTARASSSRW
jgi:VCBS repeat-containing protein